ncbi:MAG: glutamyl-tRNA reductase [Magnetococcales bacterium]|nr:glutamyl-tRNA reductase [Magnetococcales bacterium]
MKIAVVGLNHRSAPVAMRERLALTEERIPEHLAALLALPEVTEGVLISTCNRVEAYLATPDSQAAAAAVSVWLARHHGLEPEALAPHLYHHTETQAIRHGFRVAASLDSMVVGEPQILGQVKQAYQQAAAVRASGPILNKFFHQAFRVAKRVRTETAIARNAVSVSYAAVTLARKIFGSLEGKTCLLIGAGEMCELAARHLVDNGVGQVLVTNRTFARAEILARAFSGHAFPLDQLGEILDRSDVVISSTGSTTYLVDAPMVRAALKRRRQRPIFFIDIAVPRDLDPRIAELDSAFLYNMDDLNHLVAENRKERDNASEAANHIIEAETANFLQWLGTLKAVPTIVALRHRMEMERDRELERLLGSWPELGPTERERIREGFRRLVNKLFYTPATQLRVLAIRRDGDLYLDAVHRLFDLDDPAGITPENGAASGD